MRPKDSRRLGVLCVAAVLASSAVRAQQAGPHPQVAVDRSSPMPPAFIANVGQWPQEVRFAARFPDLDAFFETSSVTLSLKARRDESPGVQAVATLRFESTQQAAELIGVDRGSATYNFLLGRETEDHVVDVPSFQAVRYRGVQRGIDVDFVVRDGHLAFDVQFAPGADPASLIVACEGDGELASCAGGLQLRTALGTLSLSSPVAWEESPSSGRRALPASFQALDMQRWSFDMSNWDRLNPAVIDPGITWATYVSGSDSDLPKFLKVEAGGTVLVGGQTDSFNFPTTPGAYDGSLNNGSGIIKDVFLARLDPTGSSLLAATFLGGSQDEIPGDFAVDDRGRVVVVGLSYSDDYPLTANAYNSNFSAEGSDGFVTILDPTLSQLQYSSCMGAPALEDAGAGKVAISQAGTLICLGGTFTGQAVATPGAYDTTFNGVADVVVFELDPSLPPASQLVFLTYLGGSDLEYGKGDLCLAPDGRIIVGADTTSPDFPVTPGAFDTDFGGSFNSSFIAAFSPDGSTLEWATFVKSTGLEAIDVAADGSVTACFDTSSTISPVTPGAFDTTPNGDSDAYICRLDPTGSRLLWGSFLGGSNHNYALGLDVDDIGNVMLCGRTSSPNFPTTPGAHDTTFSGACSDGFVAYLSSEGSQLLYSSYLGSGSSLCLEANVITALDVGVALVAGHTPGNFPVTPGAYDTTYGGGASGDGFVVKMPLATPWTNLGQGLAGTLGIPKLSGTGWLVAGDQTTLTLTRAKPGSSAAMIVGFSELSVPFKGGVLVPFPNFIFTGLPIAGNGTLTLTATWPAGVPANLTLFFQDWVVDPAAVAGLSASNALTATTP